MSSENPRSIFQQAARLMADADALVITAGAGMGVDSGLPDFRGNEGFWRTYPTLERANLKFAEVATPQTFEQNPSLAWGFYGHRLSLYRKTVPHAGFHILQRWAERMPLGARVFTSNVDGQFQRAGFSQSQIHECHGSIHHLQCINLCTSCVWSADQFVPQVDADNCRLMNSPPRCLNCGEIARPNVLMFNDSHWAEGRSLTQAGIEAKWLATIAESQARIVVVEMGAGTSIPSVRHFSHRVSHELDGCIIRINPRESQVPSSRDIGIAAGSLDALRGVDLALEDW